MLQGSNASLNEAAAKRASALCGLIWRSHVDANFHTTSASSFATHSVEAVGIRRDPDSKILSILLTVAEKDSTRAAGASALRLWAVAPVKERMLVSAAGPLLTSQDEITDNEKLLLINKAEGMSDHLRQELNGFTMPA